MKAKSRSSEQKTDDPKAALRSRQAVLEREHKTDERWMLGMYASTLAIGSMGSAFTAIGVEKVLTEFRHGKDIDANYLVGGGALLVASLVTLFVANHFGREAAATSQELNAVKTQAQVAPLQSRPGVPPPKSRAA